MTSFIATASNASSAYMGLSRGVLRFPLAYARQAAAVIVGCGAVSLAHHAFQCDVPSERDSLLPTLYLPTGLRMGNRLTSRQEVASSTSSAPSVSMTLANR